MSRLTRTLIAALALALPFALAQDTPETVVDIAAGDASFSTLVAAVTQADLVATLQSEGPFTVFAPTDAAFSDLLAQLGVDAEALLARDDLGQILTYHVVAGNVMAADVLALIEAGGGEATVETVLGQSLVFTVEDGVVVINGSSVVSATDLMAGNGVVHVIDSVLLPSE